jgi:hypothetical protein
MCAETHLAAQSPLIKDQSLKGSKGC